MPINECCRYETQAEYRIFLQLILQVTPLYLLNYHNSLCYWKIVRNDDLKQASDYFIELKTVGYC